MWLAVSEPHLQTGTWSRKDAAIYPSERVETIASNQTGNESNYINVTGVLGHSLCGCPIPTVVRARRHHRTLDQVPFSVDEGWRSCYHAATGIVSSNVILCITLIAQHSTTNRRYSQWNFPLDDFVSGSSQFDLLWLTCFILSGIKSKAIR